MEGLVNTLSHNWKASNYSFTEDEWSWSLQRALTHILPFIIIAVTTTTTTTTTNKNNTYLFTVSYKYVYMNYNFKASLDPERSISNNA